MQAIKEYYKEDPDDFAWHLYNYYLNPANERNPQFRPARKVRGKLSREKLTRADIWETKRASRHLYVYLDYWLKQGKNKYPGELKNYIKKKV